MPLRPVYSRAAPASSRGFSVPEASEDEYSEFNDSDLEYLGQTSPRSPSIEIVAPPLPPKVPSVPNSVISRDSDSTSSEIADMDSHTSDSVPDEPTRTSKQSAFGLVKASAQSNGKDKHLRQPLAPLNEGVNLSNSDLAHEESRMADKTEIFDDEVEDILEADDILEDEDLPIPPISPSFLHYSTGEEPVEEANVTAKPSGEGKAKDHRDPSPSDAAMVKPTTSTENATGRLPSISESLPPYGDREHYYQPTLGSFHAPGLPCPVSSSHKVQSNLYVPATVPAPPLPAQWGYGLPPSQSNSAPYTAQHHAPTSATFELSFDPAMYGEDSVIGCDWGEPVTYKSTSKRKADLISSDEPSSDQQSIFDGISPAKSNSSRTEPELMTSPLELAKDITRTMDSTIAVAKDIAATVSMPEFKEERASKRAKRANADQTSRGSTVARYAANALGWMTIGAAGAVFALVSLPEDFFA